MGWDGQDHTSVVAAAKMQLVAAGADLTGLCGAFKITNRVAWILRSTGAGLLSKTSGANCQGYAADVVVYEDGTAFDSLIEKLGAQTPAWQQQAEPVDPTRWRPPVDPMFHLPPTEPPAPAPPDLSVDLALRLAHIDGLLVGIAMQVDDSKRAIQQQIDQAIKNAERSAAPIVALLEGLTK